MRTYEASEWEFGKTAFDIKLTTKDFIELDVVSAGTITIEGVSAHGDTMPLMSQPNHIHVKHKFNDFIELHVTSTKPMGFRLVNTAKQIGEPMDHRTPPPPKEPTNILQQMRSIIKTELAANRENFLVNDTHLPGYELDEDDETTFEEEQLQAAAEAVQAQKAKLQAPAPKQAEKPAEPAPTPTEDPSNE